MTNDESITPDNIRNKNIIQIQNYLDNNDNVLNWEGLRYIGKHLNEVDIPFLKALNSASNSSDIMFSLLGNTEAKTHIFSNPILTYYLVQNHEDITRSYFSSWLNFTFSNVMDCMNSQAIVDTIFSLKLIDFTNEEDKEKIRTNLWKLSEHFAIYLLDHKLIDFSEQELETIYYHNINNYSTQALDIICSQIPDVDFFEYINKRTNRISQQIFEDEWKLFIDHTNDMEGILKRHPLNKDSLDLLLNAFSMHQSDNEEQFQQLLNCLEKHQPELINYLLQSDFYLDTDKIIDTKQLHKNMILKLKLDNNMHISEATQHRLKI